jgi:hypothetical protein
MYYKLNSKNKIKSRLEALSVIACAFIMSMASIEGYI